MQINGGCHCGAITFTAEVDPDKVSICHCTDCQALTGTAYRVAVPAPAASVKITGTPRIYVKTSADSGARRRQAFCPDCATPIYATEDSDTPQVLGLRVGAIAQRASLPPQIQIWRKSALPWALDLHDVPARDGQT